MKKKKWGVIYPDGHETSDMGIHQHEDGEYETFGAAKKEFISSINNKIWALRELKKQIKASKRADWLTNHIEGGE